MAAPMLVPEPPLGKPSHQKYRAILKKEKRKKKRQALAKLRDSEAAEKDESVSEEEEEEVEEEEEEEEEKKLEAERQKLHEQWLLREEKAQEEFKLKKEKEEAARKRQEEEERKIKEEWEEQQRKEREVAQQKQQEKREREAAVQRMLDQAESQLENGVSWHNPEPPENLGTEKDRANCPFYIKTGSCRFGDRCSRKHNYPTSSKTLLVRGMFITFGMEQCRRDDYDTDASLEYSDEETYQQFLEFYEDVLPEFQNVGKVVQFKVSCNYEPHLRGNVYVQYQSEKDCQAALALFSGRWYAGRQLHCEFCPVTRWKTAICGLFERQKCPRGKHCNFLHVFKNQTTSFGRPIETYVFLLNGLISCLRTLRGETDRAIVTTITAAPGEGAARAQTIPTAETENQRGKRVAAKTRGGAARGGRGAERGGGLTAGAGRGEAAAAAAAGVTVGHAAGAEAGAPLDPGAGVKRDQAAEEKIVKLPKQSENYFQKSLIDKNRADKSSQ